jgi:hypothetical protein
MEGHTSSPLHGFPQASLEICYFDIDSFLLAKREEHPREARELEEEYCKGSFVAGGQGIWWQFD